MDLAQMSTEDRQAFIKEFGLERVDRDQIIRQIMTASGQMLYFTAGEKEVRAWTVKKGSTAPQAAGVIHTDFERGFIRAETIGFDDFVKYKGESGSRDAGRLRLEGKDYLVKEGDVLHFRFNV